MTWHANIKTYNKQIEEQENEINEDTPKVIKDVLISSVNVLKEQRTFYNKISEQFYNLSEEETQSQKSLSSLIRTMQKDVVSKYETSRKNDPIAVQIDNEIVVGLGSTICHRGRSYKCCEDIFRDTSRIFRTKSVTLGE
jgi:predicted  nucleic acid-binding Zn-ribbon protein